LRIRDKKDKRYEKEEMINIKAWIDLCFLTLATFAYFLAFEKFIWSIL
jgi:hypothetical protein